MDASQLAHIVFYMAKVKKQLDQDFNKIKHDVDIQLSEWQRAYENMVDTIALPKMVLMDRFVAIIKADKKTQDTWLKQLEKGLGLSPKGTKKTTETTAETVNKVRGRLPSSEKMYQKMISKKGLNF